MPSDRHDPPQPRPFYSTDLLTSLDQGGARQADPGATPPHTYIPAGPVEAAPYLGYCLPEVRQEASPRS
jgi:hypothetical protein